MDPGRSAAAVRIPAGSLEEITKSIKILQIKRLQAFDAYPITPKYSIFHKFLVSNSVSSRICKIYSPESLQLIVAWMDCNTDIVLLSLSAA